MSKFYCPTCMNELEEMSACGSVSFFCNECKGLVSRSKMLSEEDKIAKESEESVNKTENK